MKVWIKIYLFSVILLISILSIAGFTLIQDLHNNLLKREIERCIDEEKIISMNLKINTLSLQKKLNSQVGIPIGTIIKQYNDSIHDNSKTSIRIIDSNNEIIYKDINFPESEQKEELENLSLEKINYILRTIGDKHYLYLCSISDIYDMQVKVHMAKDITSIYEEKNKEGIVFIKFSILICLLFALFMYFISRLITKPINTLMESTNQIISGEYNKRIEIKSHDEFNILSNNFNKMTETVESKITELEKSNIEKETLISNLTHELKTPLTSIIGYSNLIRTSKYDEELFFECADYIYKEGKRLEQMTFKMMNLIYAKNVKSELIPNKVLDVLLEVKKSLYTKLKLKNIELIIKGNDCTLYMDKDLIIMSLCNIVENAIKASKNDSKIYLKVHEENEKILISVEDLGMGIPKEHLDRILQPFYVVDKSRSRKNNGSGIGLSICKKVAEIHNGEIKIKSEVNKGTIVTMIFNK